MVFSEVETTTNLLQIFKDLNPKDVVPVLSKLHKQYPGKEVQQFLKQYFWSKDESVLANEMESECKLIAKLFPYYSADYINSLLTIIGNEPNRVTIVIRQILAKEAKRNKRTMNHNQEFGNKKMCLEEVSDVNNDFLDFSNDDLKSNEEGSQVNLIPKAFNNIKVELKRPRFTVPFIDLPTSSGSTLDNSSTTKAIPQFYVENLLSTPASKSEVKCTPSSTISSPFASVTRPSNSATTDYCKSSASVNSLAELPNDIITGLITQSPTSTATMEIVKQPSSTAVKPERPHSVIDNMSATLKTNNELFHRSDFIGSEDFMQLFDQTDSIDESLLNEFITPEVSDLTRPSTSAEDNLPHNFLKSSHRMTLINRDESLSKPATIPRPYKSKSSIFKQSFFVNNRNDTPINLTLPHCEQPLLQFMEPPHAGRPPTMRAAENQNQDIAKCANWIKNHRRGFQKLENKYFNYVDSSSNGSNTDSDEEVSQDEVLDVDDYKSTFGEMKVIPEYDKKLVSSLMEMFPDACPAYIKAICSGRINTNFDVESLIEQIFSNPNYPKRNQKEPSPEPDLDVEGQFNILKEILPDADPNFLRVQADLLSHDKEQLKEFIANAVEKHDYPTMKEYLRKQQISAQEKQYTTEFNVEKFLEVIPNPEAYFNDPERKSTIAGDNSKNNIFLEHYAIKFLRNTYNSLPVRTITSVFVKEKSNLTMVCKILDKYVKTGKGIMKCKRKIVPIPETIQHIPLLQEIAFLQHREEIKDFLEEKANLEKLEIEKARVEGLFQSCNCCYDEEVMPKNIATCDNGCIFCKSCIQKSVEVAFGEGKLNFSCLADCSSQFSLQTLQMVLTPKLFSKMAQKKQLEEVKAAGIEDLESCPFCDFASIPAPGDKIFRCLNPDCMKESCRQCKESSHVPLRCDEIEKDDDVKRRVYIENKMTEALLRKCYKCGMKFIKSDGCNKMTCSCGAMMCYICGKPVDDYKHFNGLGGDRYHLCPLYSDTHKLHQDAVLKSAEEAKAEIGVNEDPKKLKIDPASDLEKHYKDMQLRNPQAVMPLPDGAHPLIMQPHHHEFRIFYQYEDVLDLEVRRPYNDQQHAANRHYHRRTHHHRHNHGAPR